MTKGTLEAEAGGLALAVTSSVPATAQGTVSELRCRNRVRSGNGSPQGLGPGWLLAAGKQVMSWGLFLLEAADRVMNPKSAQCKAPPGLDLVLEARFNADHLDQSLPFSVLYAIFSRWEHLTAGCGQQSPVPTRVVGALLQEGKLKHSHGEQGWHVSM